LHSYKSSLKKSSAAIALVMAVVLTFAGPAAAHDPIFLGDDQTTPDTGPYMPDGTISWALYGVVLDAGDTRGFEFDLRAGDELYISLLIPNLEPETGLADNELPTIDLETPSGEVKSIVPEIREVFDEPFSNTSYVTLAEIREPGEAGRYRGVVIGNAPSRFSVAIGEEEIFFTETERSGDRPSTFMDIAAPLNVWYSTAPGEEPAADAADGDAEIQMDLIEDAMESGEASMGDEEAVDDEAGNEEADGADADGDAENAAVAVSEADDDDGSGLAAIALPVVVVAAAVAGFLVYRRRQTSDGTVESAAHG